MALFTEEEARDIREYVFALDSEKRFKILQSVRIIEDDGADEDTLVSTMYHMAANPKEIDRIHSALVNADLIPSDAFEDEKVTDSKEG